MGETLSAWVPHLLKNPLLTQTPDEALRNQDKTQGQENHRGGEARGDPGDLGQPLQTISKGKVVGVQKPGPNSDALLMALRGSPASSEPG